MNKLHATLRAAIKAKIFDGQIKIFQDARPMTVISYKVPHSSFSKNWVAKTRCCILPNLTMKNYLPGSSVTSIRGFATNEPENKPSLYQRFKLMYKEYWYVLLPVHVVTSAFWLGNFYYLAVSGVDIAALLDVIGAPDSWVTLIRESKAGGIVTAYTMYKIATPVRYTVTLGGTTVTINYLKKWGMIKPMPSQEELKVMYEGRKSAIKDKISATTEGIKDEFAKTRNDITQHMKEAKTGFKESAAETRDGFKEGLREAADEWRHVGKLVKRNVKEIMKSPKKDENK